MLTDALADSIAEVTNYLENPLYQGIYKGQTRQDIVKLRSEMKKMLKRLSSEDRRNPQVLSDSDE